MDERVTGIVIRKMDYKENDVIVTLFTRQRGKMGVLVNGARKTRSRYGAVAQTCSVGEYVVSLYPPHALAYLKHGERTKVFRAIQTDVLLMAYVAFVVECVDVLFLEGQASAPLYDQLYAVFEAIDQGKPPAVIASVFVLQLLCVIGLSPALQHCSHCGRTWAHDDLSDRKVGWSVRSGGCVCIACLPRVHGVDPINPSRVKLLVTMQHADIACIGDVQLQATTIQWLMQTIWQWLDCHAHVRIKSRAVIEQLTKGIEG
jgi:DNA repair protein RecO (recombination protein O)